MTAALGLPLALALGIVADAVAGLSVRLAGGERRWWRGITDRWGELRRLMGAGRAGERASVLEALAAGGSMLGTLVLAVAGALRTALAPSGGPAGRAFLAATARWAAWGATAAVAGALLGGLGGGI